MASRARASRPKASDAFPKVRRDHARETAEDYVEAIGDISERAGACRVADLARHMRVSHVTVVRTIARLSAAGLVEKERYGPVQLTPSGARMAAGARERHRQVFAFLVAIGVPEAVARRDAEGLEHHVSPATIAAMRRVVA
jgi:DtxR family manganese transport transcriptional regulator